jgi:hypothetical protein
MMDPWTAATEAFGRDMDFLKFNNLSIAMKNADGKLNNPIFITG